MSNNLYKAGDFNTFELPIGTDLEFQITYGIKMVKTITENQNEEYIIFGETKESRNFVSRGIDLGHIKVIK